jgi:putative addiction module killer protein
MRRGEEVVLLLIGGDKSSQRRDIARAKRLAREVNEDGRNDPAL